MTSGLQALFYEGVFPFEQAVPKSPEYRQLYRKIDHEIQYLTEKLPQEAAARLEELEDLHADASTLYGCACFAYGFKLAARLMGATFADE